LDIFPPRFDSRRFRGLCSRRRAAGAREFIAATRKITRIRGAQPLDDGGEPHRGARGRTDAPKIVYWYMETKIDIDDLITHTMPLADITRVST
jgi:Zn-dependent alcohol dehydrogenase